MNIFLTFLFILTYYTIEKYEKIQKKNHLNNLHFFIKLNRTKSSYLVTVFLSL